MPKVKIHEYRYVGFIPTTSLNKVLEMIEHYMNNDKKWVEDIEVIELKAFKNKQTSKTERFPLPFFTAIKKSWFTAEIDYNFTYHLRFTDHLKKLREAIEKSGVGDMVVEKIVFSVPKEYVLSEELLKKDKYFSIKSPIHASKNFAAVFESKFAGRNGVYAKIVAAETEEERREYKFKTSALDLVKLQDLKYEWAKNKGTGYPLGEDSYTISRVLLNIDPDQLLVKVRQLEKTKVGRWRPIKVKAPGEWINA